MWRRLTLAVLPALAACAAAEVPVKPPPIAPAPPPVSALPQPTSAPPEDPPEAKARAFIAAVAARRFEAAVELFDAEMQRAMPAEALAAFWKGIEEAGGPFQAIDEADTDVEEGYRVVRLTCRFGHLRRVLRVVLDDEAKVAGLFFSPVLRELEATARALVDRLSRADYDGAVAGFDTLMRGLLPPSRLRTIWQQLVRKHGPFAEVSRASAAPVGAGWGVVLTCRFGSAAVGVRVIFDASDQIAGLTFLPGEALAPWSPPAYVARDRFIERPIAVSGPTPLPGTLTLPKGQAPFPVVVLIHGSGPSDADASVGPNKIFKDLAWGLASRGVAVLRYEKRTHVVQAGISSVREEVLDDAKAAIDLALHTREIDPKRVVVAGHSQGGYLAPRIAAESPGVAAIAVLAGPSRPLEDSLLDQLSYLSRLDPRSAERRRLVEAARAFKKKVEDPLLGPDDLVELPIGAAEKGAYFLSLRGYEPTIVAAGLTVPMLFLQGDRDYQVTAVDFEGWKKALFALPRATFKRYPALNHLFIAGTGAPRPSEYETPGHVEEAVIEDLAAFIAKL